MVYFVSGHRDLTKEEFEEHYVPRINDVINRDNCVNFVVGDWEGCDFLFMNYIQKFEDYEYGYITIYCVQESRIGCFDHKTVGIRYCDTYDECDAAMTEDSDFDIAWIRPGKEDSHTAMNIKRRYGLL